MVESMDHSEDVERLFSWLKAPMVHYREFAPQRELAEAVATWPVVHRAAVETGIAVPEEAAPERDLAAKERLARDRAMMPAAAARAIEANPLPGMAGPTPGRLSDRPAAEGAAAPTRGRLSDTPSPFPPPADEVDEGAEPDSPLRREGVKPLRDANAPLPREMVEPRRPAEPARRAYAEPPPRPVEGFADEPAEPRHYPAPERAGLFSGEYRGRERDVRDRTRVAGRQDRTLDAVFSRISGSRDRLPDPRSRARTTPGLGSVFNRLR